MNTKVLLSLTLLVLLLGCTGAEVSDEVTENETVSEVSEEEVVTEATLTGITQVGSEAEALEIGGASIEQVQELQAELLEITAMMADLY